MKAPESSPLPYPAGRSARNAARRLLAVLAFAWATLPGGVVAQQQSPPLDRDALVVFAHAHLEMNQARDELHAELGRTHEEPARERARAAFEAKVAEILSEHDLTRERYDQIVLRVSIDQELRTALDEILAELSSNDPGSPG